MQYMHLILFLLILQITFVYSYIIDKVVTKLRDFFESFASDLVNKENPAWVNLKASSNIIE